MKRKYAHLKFGLLGGGQLARMLTLKGHEMGLEMHVFSSSADDPAAQVTQFWHQADLGSKADLSALKNMDAISFESEFLDANLLTELKCSLKLKIQPSPQLMGKLQDRLPQKNLLVNSGLKTADYIAVDSTDDLETANTRFPSGFVLKKRLFGYDGYGTMMIRSNRDLKKAEAFVDESRTGLIAESLLDFKRELAVITVRNSSGEIIFLPLVETKQVDSRCYWVKGPVTHNNLTTVKKNIRKLLRDSKYVGLMAFELFDMGSQLIVNEIAPRVHNSGHYSLDALTEDQFSLHLKAVLNMPLKSPKVMSGGFAMVNLLGSTTRSPKWQLSDNYKLHWYGKKDNRKGRKMGHINGIGSSPNQALRLLLKHERDFQL